MTIKGRVNKLEVKHNPKPPKRYFYCWRNIDGLYYKNAGEYYPNVDALAQAEGVTLTEDDTVIIVCFAQEWPPQTAIKLGDYEKKVGVDLEKV